MDSFLNHPKFNLIRKPARYTNSEWNISAYKNRPYAIKLLLAFPDVYEIGMSYYGLSVLYEVATSIEDVFVDRIFAPWGDFENFLRQNNQKLTSLHSNLPLCDFDIIGFSIQYELNYTNILNILNLGGIKLRAAERKDVFPLIIGGG